MTTPLLQGLSAFGSVTASAGDSDTGRLTEFQEMALSLMAQHGLSDWNFALDQARKRSGQCRHSTQTLTFSAPLMSLWTEEQQRDTVLHEIAHALAPGHGHDATWKLTCLRIGASPVRTWGHDNEEALEPRWTATCPNGHEMHRDRKPSRAFSCGECNPVFDARYVFTWNRNY